MSIKIKLTNGAKELTKGSEFSTGLDLRARGYSTILKSKESKNIISEPIWFDDNIKSITIKPLQRILIKTGVHIQPDEPEKLEDGSLLIIDTEINNRSGLTLKEGILCHLGIIDSDFRNDVGCSIINLSEEDYTINENDAIGQLCFKYAVIPNIIYTDELNSTDRGLNGFGSSGK